MIFENAAESGVPKSEVQLSQVSSGIVVLANSCQIMDLPTEPHRHLAPAVGFSIEKWRCAEIAAAFRNEANLIFLNCPAFELTNMDQ